MIIILDFGSQYSQNIARKVREAKVYCELFPWDTPADRIKSLNPDGFILSGGPASVYEHGAPFIPDHVLNSGLPILGICYGMQAMANQFGGQVSPAAKREYGYAMVETIQENPLLSPGSQQVWMSHGDRIEKPPAGFSILACSPNSPVAAIGDTSRKLYGLQFHPEVNHTTHGKEILSRFVIDICGCQPDWTPESIITLSTGRIREQVGDQPVLAAVSGGVDSSVATALAIRAVGNQVKAVFVDNGLLRSGERQQVESAFRDNLNHPLVIADSADLFINRLAGIREPEKKRRIIGDTFIRVFEKEALRLGQPKFLVQGTIYPDVVESSAADRSKGDRIKTHHNVGGLPENMQFKLVEPLRYLFKDEVRAVGEALGLPAALVWRQPFPGPGLAVRCLGEITPERLERLREADAIFTDELRTAGLLDNRSHEVENSSAQAFAVLLSEKSVGVMGDQRTYQEAVALRAVTTLDFMTAEWTRLPHDLLAKVSNRIVNEVKGINRVVFDITGKPPSTIEWE